ncbi:hypothetical protein Tco_0153603 [Tanacetum coccineum]
MIGMMKQPLGKKSTIARVIQASFKRAHLTKECPLEKEDKAVEQSEKVKARTTMGKESVKELVPHNLPPMPFLGHLKAHIGSPNITCKTVCMIENPGEVHKLKAREDKGDRDVMQSDMLLGPIHDKEEIIREQDYDIPLQDGMMQPLTPQTVHIKPPNDDYVAPATSPTLDKQLNEFGMECTNITRIAEMADGNPVNDIKELSDIIMTSDFEIFVRMSHPSQHYGVTWTLDCAVTSFKPTRWKVHVSSLRRKPLTGLLVMSFVKGREREKDKACAKLEMRCNDALQDLDKNSLVLDIREEIETLQGKVDRLHGEYSRLVLEEKKWVNYEQTLDILSSKVEGLESERERLKKSGTQQLQEIDGLRQDRAAVVAKVMPRVVIKLVCSDKIGLFVACLAKAALFHGRCSALEEVAALKEPFELEKMPGYRPFSKKEFD